MVADREIVRDRLDRVRQYLGDLEVLGRIALSDFLANRERQYAVLHAMQLAIEAALEAGTHICSSDGLGVPATYVETFDLLERAGLLAPDLAGRLRTLAKLRNRMVHFYWKVDLDQVHVVLTTRLGDLREYLVAVETYLGP
jgi:uncharacterized protein YutE (UPF0331/DUF86 family)